MLEDAIKKIRQYAATDKNVLFSGLENILIAYDKKPELIAKVADKKGWKFGDLIKNQSTGKLAIHQSEDTGEDFQVLCWNDYFYYDFWKRENCEKIGSGYQYVSLEGIRQRLMEGK